MTLGSRARLSRGRWWVPILFVFFVAYSIAVKTAVRQRRAEASASLVGTTVAAAGEIDLGDGLRVGELAEENNLVVLVFWASWCAPCRAELDRLAEEYPRLEARAVKVVAISGDSSRHDLEVFLDQRPLPFSVLHDPEQKHFRAYRIASLPTTVVIDRDLEIVAVHEGVLTNPYWTIDQWLRSASPG